MAKNKKSKDTFIPKARHPMGYTGEEIATFMSKGERTKFFAWMNGQTGGVSEDGDMLFYTWDVKRFLAMVREGTPTYFD